MRPSDLRNMKLLQMFPNEFLSQVYLFNDSLLRQLYTVGSIKLLFLTADVRTPTCKVKSEVHVQFFAVHFLMCVLLKVAAIIY